MRRPSFLAGIGRFSGLSLRRLLRLWGLVQRQTKRELVRVDLLGTLAVQLVKKGGNLEPEMLVLVREFVDPILRVCPLLGETCEELNNFWWQGMLAEKSFRLERD
jgi:hypothetical protein